MGWGGRGWGQLGRPTSLEGPPSLAQVAAMAAKAGHLAGLYHRLSGFQYPRHVRRVRSLEKAAFSLALARAANGV